jgi:Holliday junction resolvasome RuvABC endonuclease subunit
MLVVPNFGTDLKFIAMDPGTETLGVAILSLNLCTLQTDVLDAGTFNARHHLKNSESYNEIIEDHGERRARLLAHQTALSGYLQAWTPHRAASESPFMGIRAQAFEALVECVSSIREAVYLYNPAITLEMVPPPVAKKAVGVIGRGTTKDEVRNGVLNLVNSGKLGYKAHQVLTQLDEHSIDAIAVGYHVTEEFKSTFLI